MEAAKGLEEKVVVTEEEKVRKLIFELIIKK